MLCIWLYSQYYVDWDKDTINNKKEFMQCAPHVRGESQKETFTIFNYFKKSLLLLLLDFGMMMVYRGHD